VPQGKGARFGKRPLQKLTKKSRSLRCGPHKARASGRDDKLGLGWGRPHPEGVSYSRGELQQRAMGEATV